MSSPRSDDFSRSRVKRLKSLLQTQNVFLNISSWLLAVGLLLTGVGGGFAPWVWRESVALQLTAPGLAEFVKFLPEVRLGQVQLQRLFFLAPLFWAMLALPLLLENHQLSLPVWLRWGLRLAVLPLGLAALSPVWTPAILIAPEFRLQTLLAIIAGGLALIAPIFRRWPFRLLVSLCGAAGLAALILPGWQFSLIQAGLAEAYHEPVSLGWGWWLTVSGVIISLLGGAGLAFLIPSANVSDHSGEQTLQPAQGVNHPER